MLPARYDDDDDDVILLTFEIDAKYRTYLQLSSINFSSMDISFSLNIENHEN